jgi:hypothetical protein
MEPQLYKPFECKIISSEHYDILMKQNKEIGDIKDKITLLQQNIFTIKRQNIKVKNKMI